ncbi:TIGR03619 family F420-dependent LLM class oxidoreductase [Haliea sp. E17]|uniref:TIGR03619 family F420-dependent LLM class oxidoreductase n=1 Tax=Haliea sp. E17 TaxID=3401576 RepID=UPI003AAFE212
MKIGVIPINIDVAGIEDIVGIARHAEAAGCESVWTAEHVIIPTRLETDYPYSQSGEMPLGGDMNFFDPLVTLSAVAAATSTLKLGTGINILPQTNPLLFAKQAASLDVISGGRLMLGLGLGWMREEFRAMGTPFEKRGARFDDYLQALRKAWSGEEVNHQSEFLDWRNFRSFPIPVAKSDLPVFIGGHAGKAFLRAARYGQGWYPAIYSAAELAPNIDRLRAACAEVGRDFNELEITSVWANTGGLDELRRLRDLGVSRVTVPLQSLPGSAIDGISWLADEVIGRL